MKYLFLFLISLSIYSQSQDEILRDLREDNVPYKEKDRVSEISYLEKLKTIFLAMGTAMENKEDRKAIEEANQMEKSGITANKIKIRGYAELGEEQMIYLKIIRLRGEAYYNLREFKNALPDSKFIVENHPKPIVFDFTRYAVSLYYSGNEKQSKQILDRAKEKFQNQNDQVILSKTSRLLFPSY